MKPHDLDALARRLAPTHAQLNATELSRVLGFKSPWVMAGLKVAARQSGDSPFRGHFSTVSAVRDWLKRHPDFVASHYLRKTTRPPRGSNPPSRAADTPGESSPMRAPQTPSPARSAPLPAPSA